MEQLPGYHRPLTLVAAGLLMAAAGMVRPRMQSLIAREAVSLVAVFALAVATAAIISLSSVSMGYGCLPHTRLARQELSQRA